MLDADISTFSLHDALPIFSFGVPSRGMYPTVSVGTVKLLTPLARLTAGEQAESVTDRKSTSLNSSHRTISYAVFCLKKNKTHDSVSTVGNDHKILQLKPDV